MCLKQMRKLPQKDAERRWGVDGSRGRLAVLATVADSAMTHHGMMHEETIG